MSSPSSPEQQPNDSAKQQSVELVKLPIVFEAEHTASTGTAAKSEEPIIDLVRILSIILQRLFVVLFCVLFFLGLGVLQVYRTQPEYTSVTKLQYEPTKTRVLDFGSKSTVLYQPFEINTAVEFIRSTSLASEALNILESKTGTPAAAPTTQSSMSPLGLAMYYISQLRDRVRSAVVSYKTPDPTPESDAQAKLYSLLQQIRVYNVEDSKIIHIEARASNNQRARDIADAFALAFTRSVTENQQQNFVSLQEVFRNQIAEIQEKIDELEAERLKFRETNETRVTKESRDLAVTKLEQLDQNILDLKQQYVNVASLQEVDSLEATRVDLFQKNPIYQSLTNRKGELLLERSKLSAGSLENFDPLKNIDLQIEEINRQISEFEQQAEESYASEAKLLLNQIERLEALYVEQEKAIDEIDRNLIRYEDLERRIEQTRSIADALITNLDGLQVNNSAESNSVKIIEPASIPMLPSKPNVFRTIAGFLFLGFFAGIGLVLLLHVMDRTVRNPAEVESSLGLPNLGYVPYLKQPTLIGNIRGKKKPVPLVDTTSKGNAAECFRYLRTSLIYSRAKNAPQVIHVTSCLPGEGKSTVSSNLSVFFAESNARVLLIDADLKRPSIQRIFNISRTPGLADILVGQKTLEDCILVSQVKNLDILPAGTITPNPVTLLESKVMQDLLANMRLKYDVIVVDSAPTHGMADTIVLSNKVDGLLLVVRQGQTPMDILKGTTEKLRKLNVPMLGVVYNNTGASAKNFYGYYGNYGYGQKYQYSYRYDPIPDDED
ncbi:MAG: polysaccharide biosynthesis tyrosine autokinase [Candidatus Sumerlaeia bacterium]|nr:polysaccharide biosynthesis tyrosine autokinase [Candidatus Sumerlaeia bacterium]